MNLNFIEKNNKLEKKKIMLSFFSDESTLSSKSDIDEVADTHSDKKWIEDFKEESKYWW